jgi:hypothetical protein
LGGWVIVCELAREEADESAVGTTARHYGQSGQSANDETAGLVGAFVSADEQRCLSFNGVAPTADPVPEFVAEVPAIEGGAALARADLNRGRAAGNIGHNVGFRATYEGHVASVEQ